MFLDADKVGQAFDDLSELEDKELVELLPTHGFPADAVHLLRNGDRVSLIRERLDTLITGERKFMSERNVKLPSVRTAESIADSEASDEE